MNGWCKVIVLPVWLRWLIHRQYSAAAVWPFVIIRDLKFCTPVIIHHEQIHLKQQIELGILPFHIIYLTEYFYHRIKGKSHHDAYMSISFEKEAYKFEKNPGYLQERKLWAMWRNPL
jgi:hypothetical protein